MSWAKGMAFENYQPDACNCMATIICELKISGIDCWITLGTNETIVWGGSYRLSGIRDLITEEVVAIDCLTL